MSSTKSRRFLPYVALTILTLPLFNGWSSASTLSANGSYAYALAASSLSQNVWQPQGAFLKSSQSLGFQIQSLQPVTNTTFANPAFQRTWERTDRPVASGATKRSWYWGPTPGMSAQEDYAEGAGGKRLVQYFDKSRMEINNPAGNPNDPFFVTNGLLTVELISGKVQTGNATFADRYQADIPLASDGDDTTAPTYLSFAGVSNTPLGDHPATSRLAQNVTATIARNGTVGDDPTKATYPKVNIIYFEQATRHNIPLAIWEFLNEVGSTYDPATGQTKDARLSDPWFYATGYPISEAYWARVKIAGQQQDVLIQAFQRRVVTYVPNGVPGFKVQMGNIGQHYYDWRYKDAGRPQVPPTPNTTAVPTATKPAGTAVPPTATTRADPNADCSGIPASENMVVTPNCGPGGTTFRFDASGFQPGEDVTIYITLPDQAVYGEETTRKANGDGKIIGVVLETVRAFPAGIWGVTMEGLSSRSKAIARFKITSPGPTPTPGPAGNCTAPPSRNGEARPNQGRPGDTIQITVRGFRPGEVVTYWFTRPDNEVLEGAAPLENQVRSDGSIGPLPYNIDSTDAEFPGVWGLSVRGNDSGNQADVYWCVSP